MRAELISTLRGSDIEMAIDEIVSDIAKRLNTTYADARDMYRAGMSEDEMKKVLKSGVSVGEYVWAKQSISNMQKVYLEDIQRVAFEMDEVRMQHEERVRRLRQWANSRGYRFYTTT